MIHLINFKTLPLLVFYDSTLLEINPIGLNIQINCCEMLTCCPEKQLSRTGLHTSELMDLTDVAVKGLKPTVRKSKCALILFMGGEIEVGVVHCSFFQVERWKHKILQGNCFV